MEDKKRLNIKTVIMILSVLLAVSVAALAGMLIWRSAAQEERAAVTIPDNIITPDAQDGERAQQGAPEGSAVSSGSAGAAHQTSLSDGQLASAGGQKRAAAVSLYRGHAQDNLPFEAANMFPGDAETRYYCVKIAHSGDVVVRYRAAVRPGCEKLAEVLRCRVVLPTTGETLYDGLMRDMPESLNHSVKTDKSTESELYCAVTAYLDTGVGNEYQNQTLMADFCWWVQETGNLDSPQTGDLIHICLWVCLASGSLLMLLFLVRKRRKEEGENG